MSLWPWQAPLLYTLILAAALLWDRLLGEFPDHLHPVVWMGRLISAARARAPASPAGRLLWGVAMALLIPSIFALLGLIVAFLPWYLAIVPGVLLTKSAIAVEALGTAGLRVGRAVDAGDIAGARAGLSWLCSRDPSLLSGEELAGAAISSVAENASDSAIAPMLWLTVGGLPALLFYRCVNTMDAMIGYRHEPYLWLGKPAARLDDLLNWIPARVTALLLWVASADREARREGARIAWRDHDLTPSPNGGWPMAMMAGLLGIQLTKPGYYALGDPATAPSGLHVVHAWRIARRAILLCALLVALFWSFVAAVT